MKLIRNLAFVRVALVPLAVTKVMFDHGDYPSQGYERAAWAVVGGYAAVALLLVWLSYRWRGRLRYLAALSVVSDFAITTALMFAFAWEPAQPLRSLQLLVVLEAALFFRLAGGLIAGAITFPILLVLDLWREAKFDIPVRYDALVLRVVVAMSLGAVVGRLVDMERGQAHDAEERAAEAERLRDELGRRVDLLEATNRAARALGSSLDLERAFAAFVRELRSLLPFDRAAILLAEGGGARVMATAGIGAQDYLEPGSAITVPGEILEAVIEDGRTIYREDIAEDRYPEEAGLLALGVRARVLAPLQLGTRSIGALAIARTEPASFREEEIALVTFLGRLVATAVQNLRTYEAERATVDELRRLSALRADFVSLVSHELRSPMAAVIGSARTLQARWRELQAGAARGVPRRDRGRDEPAGGARRRRAGHLPDRGRHLRLSLRQRRPGGGSARLGRGRGDRAGRGAADGGAAGCAAKGPRRRRAAASARRQPDLERDQVLRLGR